MVTIVGGGVKVAGAVLKSLMRPFAIGRGDSSDDLCVMRVRTPKQRPRPANIQIFSMEETACKKRKSA